MKHRESSPVVPPARHGVTGIASLRSVHDRFTREALWLFASLQAGILPDPFRPFFPKREAGQSGQAIVEYVLIVGLLAIVIMAILQLFGTAIGGALERIAGHLNSVK